MGICDMLKDTIKRADLLGAPTILRNKGESFYQSLFGGITTIILLLMFLVIFVLKLYLLITLQDITSDTAHINNQNDTSTIDNFFFGLTLPYISNLIQNFKLKDLLIDEITQFKLVNCTKQMWNSRGIYSQFLYQGYLCPESTQKFIIYETPHKQSYLRLMIDCPNCTSLQNKAGNDSIGWDQDMYQASIWMLDTILSEANQNPQAPYIETIPFPTFGLDMGLRAQVQLAPYQIDTDVSFWPFSSNQIKNGYFIQNTIATKTLVDQGEYVVIKFEKSRQKLQVIRKYGKLDELLSYVGGLFGLLFITFSFFLSPYNEFKYQVMIGEAIFKNESLDKINRITEHNWNFWTYLKIIFYDWLTFLGCPQKKWKQMKQFTQSRTQALYLLDSKYLMKRIRYLQTAISIILPQNKQTCLRLIDMPHIQKIRKQRKTMELYDEYRVEKVKEKNKMKELANILVQQTVQNTIFHYASPSQHFLQIKSPEDLQKWKQQLSDSEYIQDDNVKNQIQIALKEMLDKKEVDDQYNKIYDLMEDDFKGWAQINPTPQKFQNKRKQENNSKISSIHDSQYLDQFKRQKRGQKGKVQNINFIFPQDQNINFIFPQDSHKQLNIKIDQDEYQMSSQQFNRNKYKIANEKRLALENLAKVMKSRRKDYSINKT